MAQRALVALAAGVILVASAFPAAGVGRARADRHGTGPRRLGKLTGRIKQVGGDPVGQGHWVGGRVVVYGSKGRVAARMTARAGRLFLFHLRPGRYEVVVAGNNFACPRRTVQIRAGRTTRITLLSGCGEY